MRAAVTAIPFLALGDLTVALLAVVALLVGLGVGWVLVGMITGNTVARARQDADQVLAAARTEAEASLQRIELEAEKKSRERRDQQDREVGEARAEIKRDQARLAKREDGLDRKLETPCTWRNQLIISSAVAKPSRRANASSSPAFRNRVPSTMIACSSLITTCDVREQIASPSFRQPFVRIPV